MASHLSSRFRGLWRHPDFLKLWAGQSVSVFGTLITRVALPVVAVLTLHASAPQVALIYAAQAVPALALGLLAGALADRMRRRPLLIAADVGRALALATIPLAALTGSLSLNLIYAVTLVTSALSALFDIAYPAYLPSLVEPEHLLEGNAKLGASMSVAEVGGFGLAGVLIQALTASGAVVVDIATYLVSIISLVFIRTREPEPTPRERISVCHALADLWHEVIEGLRLTAGDPTRRAFAAVAVVQAICGGLIETALYIYILRDLRLSAAIMGITFSIGGVAAFLGASVSERVTRRLGMRRTLRLAAWLGPSLAWAIPLAGGPAWVAIALLCVAQLGDAGYIIYDIAQVTALQTISPPGALGRINAIIRVLSGLSTLLGLALGAALGQSIGARGTLFVAMLSLLLGPLWLTIERIRPEIRSAEPVVALAQSPGNFSND